MPFLPPNQQRQSTEGMIHHGIQCGSWLVFSGSKTSNAGHLKQCHQFHYWLVLSTYVLNELILFILNLLCLSSVCLWAINTFLCHWHHQYRWTPFSYLSVPVLILHLIHRDTLADLTYSNFISSFQFLIHSGHWLVFLHHPTQSPGDTTSFGQ